MSVRIKIDKNIKLSGRVVDERGDPVIGASVYVKETFRGNITDINGNFSLEEVPWNLQHYQYLISGIRH